MSAFTVGRVEEKEESSWESLLERELSSTGYPSIDRIFASKSGLCERQTAGLLLLPDGHEEYRKASTQFYFAIGSTYEQLVERALKRSKLWIDSEFRVEFPLKDTTVSGRIDFVIRDPGLDASSDPLLVELKTCGKLPSRPKPYQLAQLHTYLLLTGMTEGLLWYISRSVADWTGSLQQVVFEISMTDKERKQTAVRLARGAVFGLANKIPAIPDHMRKYKCGFCPLVPFCWDGKDIGLKGSQPSVTENMDLLMESDKLAKSLLEQQEELREQFLDALR